MAILTCYSKRRNWSEKDPMVTSYFFMEQI